MRYNRPNGYKNNVADNLSKVVNDFRNARYVPGILYAYSKPRAEREKISRPRAFIRNLIDFYHNGLDSLLVPGLAYSGGAVYEPQQTTMPTEHFMGSKSTKHDRPKSNKEKKEKLQEQRKAKKKKKQGSGTTSGQGQLLFVPRKKKYVKRAINQQK